MDLNKIQDLLKTAFIIESSIKQDKAKFRLSIDFRYLMFLSHHVTFPTELEDKILKKMQNSKPNEFF